MQITNEAKNAILNCLANAAYAVDDAQSLYDALAAAFFPIESITAVYTQSGTVYNTDSLDSLKADLIVTANYEGGTSETVTAYTLSGSLTVGTSTITVTYGSKTTTFTVTVTEAVSWTFINNQSLGKSGKYVSPNNASARARMDAPVLNEGYVFTVTDPSAYSIVAYDITSNIPVGTSGYNSGSKTIAWVTSDSVTTEYVWVALKKNNGTNFTDAELANGAAAVFTYTKAS